MGFFFKLFKYLQCIHKELQRLHQELTVEKTLHRSLPKIMYSMFTKCTTLYFYIW